MAEKTTMPDDLYEFYLLDMKESEKGILAIISSKKNRDPFLRFSPMSREDFESALRIMKPGERNKFEKYLRTPCKQRIEEGMRAARAAIREFETDPRVRERATKECQRAIKKALTPRKK